MTGWLAFWLALAALFTGGEWLARSLRIAPFALGAAVAGGAAAWSASVTAQWTAFAVAASLLSLAAPVVARRLRI